MMYSMNILLTGQPHSGKTTFITKLLKGVEEKKGFITKEIKEEGQRVGFQLVSSSGATATLAHINHKSPYQVSRYFVDVNNLDRLIDPLFTFEPSQLLYIDEIGQMELFSDRFKELVLTYLNASNDFIGTVTNVYSDEFVEKVKQRDDVRIIEVTEDNRSMLADKIVL